MEPKTFIDLQYYNPNTDERSDFSINPNEIVTMYEKKSAMNVYISVICTKNESFYVSERVHQIRAKMGKCGFKFIQ